MRDRLPTLLRRIVLETPGLERCYLVGGCVRDALLGETVKDFDLEVFGTNYEDLVRALSRWGRPDLVGRSFGVIKLSTSEGTFDFSLPRRDSKAGRGHRGFTVTVEAELSPADASARRDFTINSLMYDLRRGELLDHHGGRADLEARVLRHTSPAFGEDPLRVLRGMQFAARFDLSVAPKTIALCRQMVETHDEIAVERRCEEWLKWATQSRTPSRGLRFLDAAGWIIHYPELADIRGVPQDPEWHPEGDVWQHTLHCLDELVRLPDWQQQEREARAVLLFATLLHDIGKATTTRREFKKDRERTVSPGHEAESARLSVRFMDRLGLPHSLRDHITPLMANHMAHYAEPSSRALRRLATRLQPATIQELSILMVADAAGRPPLPKHIPPTVTALLARAAELELRHAAPQPILQGRHLIARGQNPGPEFGRQLKSAFEAQLDGEFHDLAGALAWLDRTRAD